MVFLIDFPWPSFPCHSQVIRELQILASVLSMSVWPNFFLLWTMGRLIVWTGLLGSKPFQSPLNVRSRRPIFYSLKVFNIIGCDGVLLMKQVTVNLSEYPVGSFLLNNMFNASNPPSSMCYRVVFVWVGIFWSSSWLTTNLSTSNV